MPWHVYSQVGAADNFVPDIPGGDPRLPMAIDKHGSHNLAAAGLVQRVSDSGLAPSTLAIDLLNVALAVFTADMRVWRGYEADQWTRSIVLHLPVSDVAIWNGARSTVIQLASFLTGDQWDVIFRPLSAPIAVVEADQKTERPRTVCLFSGGLDSYVGAADLLSSGESVALVGHYGTKRDQDAVYGILRQRHANQLSPFWFYVLPPLIDVKHVGESTMRSRSILFLALGTLVGSALGNQSRLVVPENGLISLNVPLTFGRTGSHSTRTTHPYTVALFRRLLEEIGIGLAVELPYRFTTKGEMLRDVKSPDLMKVGVHQTMSCAHPVSGRFRGLSPGHCGYCVPCIIRRAALYSVGLHDEPVRVDLTDPGVSLSPTARADKRAFEMGLARLRRMTDFECGAAIQDSGPIEPEHVNDSVAVYRRGMAEVERFLQVGLT
jgi:7-cyano-7-deazaguanine synthase in queuosine biosynthesis